jgi:anti-sigma factor RsiW
MIESTHIQTKLTDYVLDLLPRQERQAVERHVAHCTECEQALQRERHVGFHVRRTLQRVTQPANGRYRHLMPAIPQKKSWLQISIHAQRQLASLSIVLMLLFVGWSWHESRQQSEIFSLPTAVAVTATYTTEPTATATHAEVTTEPVETAVGHNAALDYSPTPPPHPTPVAVVSAASN